MKFRLLLAAVLYVFVGQLNATPENYSIAVKGGVSLGSYEAGLNWVYLEHIKNTKAKLNTITGASAGSVNALLSALRYCDQNNSGVDNNQFSQVWEISLSDLWASNSKNERQEFVDFVDDLEINLELATDKTINGKDRGGLLNRSGVLKNLQVIDDYIKTGNFKDSCEVKMGFAITKFYPDNEPSYGITVKNQRYIIPIILKVENKQVTFINTHLFNNARIDSEDTRYLNEIDRFIFLPAQKNGEISKYLVYKAIMASSSFPIAFSPIALNYCIKTDSSKGELGSLCPPNYIAKESLFIDGGSLDNAPIGAAQRITSQLPCSHAHPRCTLADDENLNLIYINPGSIRERSGGDATDLAQVQKDSVIGLLDYLSLGGHIMEYGMSSELYRSLVEQRQKKNSLLLTSSRYYPLVGDYLQHFGAFFDQAYRQFDYYVGVYDGLYNVVQNQCRDEENSAKCHSQKMQETVEQLSLKKSEAYHMIVLLSAREFHEHRNKKIWEWLFSDYKVLRSTIKKRRTENTKLGKMIDIFLALDSRNCIVEKECDKNIEQAEFSYFLQSLTAINRYEKNTQKMVSSKKHWGDAYLKQVLNRAIHVETMKLEHLSSIEKGDKTIHVKENIDNQKGILNLLKVLSVYGESAFARNANGYWPSSTVDGCWQCFNRRSHFIPDEIGMHTDNLGGYISYRLVNREIVKGLTLDMAFDPVHFALRTDDYASVQGLVRHDFENPLLTSLGFGLKGYQTYGKSDRFPDNTYYGVIARLGLLADKIKLTAGWRFFSKSVDNRQRFELTIGFSDVKGFLYLLSK